MTLVGIFNILLLITQLVLSQVQTSVEYVLRGLVIDELTETIINQADVTIYGSDSSKFEIQTDEKGYFYKNLNTQVSYLIVISKSEYLKAKVRETNNHGSDTINHLYALIKLKTCGGYLPEIVFAKNKFKVPLNNQDTSLNIIEQYKKVLVDNPNLKIEVTGYRDFDERVSISKKRAVFTVRELIKLGIEKERLKAVDGNFDNKVTETKSSDLKELMNNRYVIFTIVGN